jgi:hypothetical protein
MALAVLVAESNVSVCVYGMILLAVSYKFFFSSVLVVIYGTGTGTYVLKDRSRILHL